METLPRRILVLGMGRSGEATARFLATRRDAGEDLTFALLDEGGVPETSWKKTNGLCFVA